MSEPADLPLSPPPAAPNDAPGRAPRGPPNLTPFRGSFDAATGPLRTIWRERTSRVAYRAAAALLLVIGLISFASVRTFARDAERVAHTNEVIDHSSQVLTQMLDVQNSVRAYAITGAPAALSTYRTARALADEDLRAWRAMTVDNPSQQLRLDSLVTLLEQRDRFSESVIEARSRRGADAAQAVIDEGQGWAVMLRIREAVESLIDEERRLLTLRTARSHRSANRTFVAVAVLLGFSLVILWRADARIRRTTDQRATAQRQSQELNALLAEQNTALETAREQALVSHRFNRAILTHAGHAIIATDAEFAITSFNPAAERMLRYREDEVLGMTPAFMLDPAEVVARAKEFSAELGEEIAPGLDVFVARLRHGLPNQFAWTFVRKDETRFPVLLSVTALTGDDGRVTGYIGLATDITERTRILDRLAAKNDELKTFAYTVSHDLKAPLRGISGYAQELERKHVGGLPERAQFCVAQISVASKNLDRLIEDLLTYSRLDAEVPTAGSVVLPVLVDRILRDRGHTLEELGVEVRVDVPEVTLVTWERGLHQILTNLIDNAVKYSRGSTPPRIEVIATASAAGVLVTVGDNGVGFDMKYHDRIFGLFNRLVRADEFEGTGAGLAIVRRLVEKIDGTISATSGPGEGARFTLQLPAGTVT